jgi:hypothetical protein
LRQSRRISTAGHHRAGIGRIVGTSKEPPCRT